jgi:hypothetical protein
MDSDGAPTQGMREVHAEHARELRQYETELKVLLAGDLARLNETARQLDIPHVIVPKGAEGTKP